MAGSVFVGREVQKNDFKKYFAAMVGEHKKISFFNWCCFRKHKDNTKLYPHVFLFYGEGGLGKSTMVQKCMEIAHEVGKEKNKPVKIVYLDWDGYYKQKSSLPNTDIKMIKALYTVLIESGIDHQKYFSEYVEIEKRSKDIHKKVEDLRKGDWTKEASTIVEGGLLAAAAVEIPIILPEAAKQTVKNTLSIGLSALENAELGFRQWLRERKKLPDDELDIYENENKKLSDALVKGLFRLCRDTTVLLVIDTYEKVDNPDIEDWMRKFFLQKLFQEKICLMLIIAGRKNHFKSYRNDLPEALLYPLNFDALLFTTHDIRNYAKHYGLELSDEEIARIESYTHGVPLVVSDLIYLLRNGADLEMILADLDAKSGEIQEVVRSVVGRFLKYCDEDTKYKAFHLSMLWEFSSSVLAALWHVPEREVTRIIRDLALRHSFISQNQMHPLVKGFILEYLMNEIGVAADTGCIMEDFFREFGETSGKIYKEQLERLEKAIPNLEERYADERYGKTLLNYFNSLAWYSQDEVFRILPGYLLECLQFDLDTGKEIHDTVNAFHQALVSRYKLRLTTWKKGLEAYESLGVWMELTPKKEELDLLHSLEKFASDFTKDQKALLCFKWAELYYRAGDLGKVWQYLEDCPPITNLGEMLKDNAIDLYFQLACKFDEEGRLKESIACNKKVTEIDPTDKDAWYNMGLTFFNMEDYYSAIDCFEKTATLKPEMHEAWYNIGTAYTRLADYDSAVTAYKKSLQHKPDKYEAWYNMGWAYCIIGEYEDAIKANRKAMTLRPGSCGAHFNMALALLCLGDKEKAVAEYDRAIALAASGEEVRSAIAALHKVADDNPYVEDFEDVLEKLRNARKGFLRRSSG